jgi:hypothetical protein
MPPRQTQRQTKSTSTGRRPNSYLVLAWSDRTPRIEIKVGKSGLSLEKK